MTPRSIHRLLSLLLALLAAVPCTNAQPHLDEIRTHFFNTLPQPADDGTPIDLATFGPEYSNPNTDLFFATYHNTIVAERRLAHRIDMIARSWNENQRASFIESHSQWLTSRDKNCDVYWAGGTLEYNDERLFRYMRCLGTETVKRLQQIREGKFRVSFINSIDNAWLNARPSFGSILVEAFVQGKIPAYTSALVVTEHHEQQTWPLPDAWQSSRLYHAFDSITYHNSLYRSTTFNRNAIPGIDSAWRRYQRPPRSLPTQYTLAGAPQLLTKEILHERMVAGVSYQYGDPWEPTIDYEPGNIAQVGKVLYSCIQKCRNVPVTDKNYWFISKHDVTLGDTAWFEPEVHFTELTLVEYLEYSGADTTYYPQMLEVGGVDPMTGLTKRVAAFRYSDVVAFLQSINEVVVTPPTFLGDANTDMALGSESLPAILNTKGIAAVDTLDSYLNIFAGRKFIATSFPDPDFERDLSAQLAYTIGPPIRATPVAAIEFDVRLIVSRDATREVAEFANGEAAVTYRVRYNATKKQFAFTALSVEKLNSEGDVVTRWTTLEFTRKKKGNFYKQLSAGTLPFVKGRRLTGFRKPASPK